MPESIRVLFVGDETGFVDAVAPSHEEGNSRFIVETAPSGSEGYDRLFSKSFDCVVSEYDLPGENGIAFLETIREMYPDLPFILFPGRGTESVASDAISAGVTDYVQQDDCTERCTTLVDSILAAVEESYRSVGADSRQHRLEQILKTVPSCVVHLDCDGRFTYANQRAKDILGLERSEVTGRAYDDPEWQISDLDGNPIPDDELPFRQVRDSGEPIYDYHHALRWPDGSRTVLSVNGAPLFDDEGDVESVVFSLKDITEQKQREQELQRYRRIVEHLDDVATVIDPDGTIEYVSPAVTRVLGYEPEELIGQNGFGYQPPETAELVSQAIEDVLATPSETRTVQTKFQQADGSLTWIESTLRNRIDDDGIGGILVSSREITRRREQKQRIRHREQQLSQLHEATRELLGAEDTQEVATMASEAAADILDLPLNGIHFYDETADGLTPTAISDASQELFDDLPVIDEGVAWDAFQQGEMRIYDDIREAKEVYNTETPVRSEIIIPLSNHGVFLISATEESAFEETGIEFARILAANTEAALNRITKEQQLLARERELEKQNDRLEEFTSVVSHDLRNPLNVAQGRLELVRENCESDQLDTVAKAHDRMESLIADLLTLARQGKSVDSLETTDLADITRTCWENVENIDATRIVETEQTIQCDRSRLQQLLENLKERQREFPAPPWAGVKRVRSAASLFSSIGTPYCDMEPMLSASQNPRTHSGIRRGAPGLCRALVKGRTPTDTPATAATDDLCCGGTLGVFGCYWFHASPRRDERGRN